MVRPLSIAELATVEIGGSFVTDRPASEVKRKAKEYGARCNPPKRFYVSDDGQTVLVTREACNANDPEPQP